MKRKIGRKQCHPKRNKTSKETSSLLEGNHEKVAQTSEAKISILKTIFCILIKVFTFIFPFFHQNETKHSSSLDVQILEEKIAKLETNIEKLTKQFIKAQKKLNKDKPVVTIKENVQSSICIPPPPSFIPPPPSLIPPPPMLNTVFETKKTQILPVKVGGRFSLSDLKSVQLKKTSNNTKEKCKSKQTGGRQLISLKDIQNVRLKSRKVRSDENENIVKNLPTKPSLSGALKKTNVVRSPGGTPLIKRDTNISSATGLTPAFTRALHKKFKSVKVSPMGNSDNLESPNKWR